MRPTEVSVRAKLKRGGALFASDEVQVLVDQIDTVRLVASEYGLRETIIGRIATAFGCPHSLLPTEVQRLAEWVVNVEPWTTPAPYKDAISQSGSE